MVTSDSRGSYFVEELKKLKPEEIYIHYFVLFFILSRDYYSSLSSQFYALIFPASSALFWNITLRRVVSVYRRFGTTDRSLEDGTDTLSRNVCKQLRHDAA